MGISLTNSALQLEPPTEIFRTVAPTRRPNAELRTREHLTPGEVETLIEAAKANRYGCPSKGRAVIFAPRSRQPARVRQRPRETAGGSSDRLLCSTHWRPDSFFRPYANEFGQVRRGPRLPAATADRNSAWEVHAARSAISSHPLW
jgi:hypothetical protein